MRSALQVNVQIRLDFHPDVTGHRMNFHAVRVDQRADRHTVAEVDADVLVAAPDNQVAGEGIGLRGAIGRVVVEVLVETGHCPPLATYAVEKASLAIDVGDEPRAVEGGRSGGGKRPLRPDFALGEGEGA